MVLTASRLSNFAIQLLSPLLLVRILDVADFGQYQEFMTYAMIFSVLCSLSIDSSLTYFIPRFPDRDRSFATQASVLILGFSMAIIGALLLVKPLILNLTTYDFVMPLACYVLFFTNLNWLEYYWVAKRHTGSVLFYSAIRLLLRISVLLFVAYTTRDLFATIWSAVLVEGCRVLLVFVYFSKSGMFREDLRWSSIVEQLKFALPVGASAVIDCLGRNVGKLFVGAMLGPTALAYYAVGSYLQPFVSVMRSGIQEAVYPELVRAHDKPNVSLQLWQRVNILNCVVFFPATVLLVFYSKEIVAALFTSEYLAAAPIFIVYAFFLIRRCFDADVLLRSTGQTRFMICGTIGALTVNAALSLLLFEHVGMIGPAIAFVASEVALELYYTQRVRHALKLTIADLTDWNSISVIAVSCVVALPIPIGFGLLPGPEIIRMFAASVLYFFVVLLLAFRFGVADIGRVGIFAWSTFMSRLGR